MSDDTTVTENQPEVQETDKSTQEPLEWNNEAFTLHGRTVEKGKNKGSVIYTIGPADGQDKWSFIQAFRRAVGTENFDKNVVSMINTSCKDSTLEAMKKAEDGVVTDEGLTSALSEWYTDASRRSGPHVKDIKERLAAIFAEVSPLMNRAFDKNAEALTQEEHNKMVQLSVEFSDLQAKLEAVQGARKGKKKAAAK